MAGINENFNDFWYDGKAYSYMNHNQEFWYNGKVYGVFPSVVVVGGTNYDWAYIL